MDDTALGSVDRALVLLAMLYGGEILSVKAAAQRLGVAPSTAHRLLSSLRSRGFAIQDRARLYRIGPAFHTTAPDRLSFASLRRVAQPYMASTQTLIGETMHLMTLQNASVYFIDGIECDLPLRVALRTGARMPAYCSAGGKAMLASMNAPQVEELHEKGLTPWPTRKITTLKALERQLSHTRERGYGLNIEETEAGVCGIGVAITVADRAPIAAITFAVPSVRFKEHSERHYFDALLSCAAAIAARIKNG